MTEDTFSTLLARFRTAEPYVWRLHVGDALFARLEAHVAALAASGTARLAADDARLVLIYMGEWYRRRYCAATPQPPAAAGIDLRQAWLASGIDTDRYVYRTDAGRRLWKYSAYVLGGLAVRHELARPDAPRFLRTLCRIYHGETSAPDALAEADEARAVAFRQSVACGHSLGTYLRALLDDSASVPADAATQALVEAVRRANDEVLRRKFSLEWLVTNPPAATTMTRRLRVWLKPERVGGALHHYLRCDRLAAWGILDAPTRRMLFLGLRWKGEGGAVVADVDERRPLLAFANTGLGFVSWGADERFATAADVPVGALTAVDVVLYDGEGHQWTAQTFPLAGWMQLWRTDHAPDLWTSLPHPQQPTAVAFTAPWHSTTPPDHCKPFARRGSGEAGPVWQWTGIHTDITLTDGRDAVRLYNRAGRDLVFARLHTDTIRYRDGGTIAVRSEDADGCPATTLLPLVYGPADLRIRHYPPADAPAAEAVSEEACEVVEFKRAGRYEPWTSTNCPPYGTVSLRTVVRGVEHHLTAVYLKGPIRRDFAAGAIRYFTLDGCEHTLAVPSERNHLPLAPAVPLRIGPYVIDVVRPTLLKLISIDGQVVRYVADGETFVLPWIYRHRAIVDDFSRRGHRTFRPAQLPSLFALIGHSTDNLALHHLSARTIWPATLLDAAAPEWLHFALAKQPARPDALPLLRCNVYRDEPPQPCTAAEADGPRAKGDVLFPDARRPDADLALPFFAPGRPDPFARCRVPDIERKCFETAVRYEAYFSLFHPLRLMMQKEGSAQRLVDQLAARHGTPLPAPFEQGLRRLDDELGDGGSDPGRDA